MRDWRRRRAAWRVAGARVVATDPSAQMIQMARRKALIGNCEQRIEFRCLPMEDIGSFADGDVFDGVLSNFGAVNCVQNLQALVADVADRLTPGAPLLWVVMGAPCSVGNGCGYLARGQWRKAWRRRRPGGIEWRGLTISYPTPARMRALLLPYFTVTRLAPLGVALPPSYAAAWLDRSPFAATVLTRLERWAQRSSMLASWSDHFIVEAVRLPRGSAHVNTPAHGRLMSAPASSTLEAYERWAPIYPPVAHNPLMRAEQRAMLEVWPNVDGRRVLDLACGSGRYSQLLREANAAQVVALDFCVPYARASRGCQPGPREHDAVAVSVGGVRRRRFRLGGGSCDRTFGSGCAEVARVLRPAGTLLYSDFHSEAIRAGMTRSFKDAANVTWIVPHQAHDLACQQDAMAAAGLTVETVRELRMGMELNEAFPGSERVYRDWHGVPVVLVVRARKTGT